MGIDTKPLWGHLRSLGKKVSSRDLAVADALIAELTGDEKDAATRYLATTAKEIGPLADLPALTSSKEYHPKEDGRSSTGEEDRWCWIRWFSGDREPRHEEEAREVIDGLRTAHEDMLAAYADGVRLSLEVEDGDPWDDEETTVRIIWDFGVIHTIDDAVNNRHAAPCTEMMTASEWGLVDALREQGDMEDPLASVLMWLWEDHANAVARYGRASAWMHALVTPEVEQLLAQWEE